MSRRYIRSKIIEQQPYPGYMTTRGKVTVHTKGEEKEENLSPLFD